MIRAGFIGAGTIASAHLAALQRLPEVRITAFADPVLERAQERAAQFGGRAVASEADLWEHADAVWVCSPPHLHAEHTIAAAQAGRHVFVEKPIAHTLEAATQMIDACRQAGVRLMVGQVLRYWPQLQRMRSLLLDGELGNLVACWSRRFGDASPAEMPWWRRDWRRGGGFTIEWGIHEVDFLRWVGEAVAGPVVRIHGRVICSRADYPEFDDFVRATLTFRSGAVGGFEGGLSVPLGGGTWRAILGTRAMVITEGRGLRLRYTGDGAERLIEVPPLTDPERRVNTAVLAEDAEFIAAITEGRDPRIPGEDGRASLALCLAIHRSSREGREVAMEDLLPPPSEPGG
jgi:myo-inositol 2-dehydrogenase/D-chiro-inositol 1-dehydrogenase/scyllo-inositol 2-dehydrogenase (NAD+)